MSDEDTRLIIWTRFSASIQKDIDNVAMFLIRRCHGTT
jgi:hypothetical protein